jgi:hypothetical protein
LKRKAALMSTLVFLAFWATQPCAVQPGILGI